MSQENVEVVRKVVPPNGFVPMKSANPSRFRSATATPVRPVLRTGTIIGGVNEPAPASTTTSVSVVVAASTPLPSALMVMG